MIRALLIQEPYISKILDGKKRWEIRGTKTLVRETICLVASGSGTVVGVCELVDCVGPLTGKQYTDNARKAGIKPEEAKLGSYKKTYAWVLKNPKRLEKPVPYQHNYGAIVWVRLTESVVKAVRRQLT